MDYNVNVEPALNVTIPTDTISLLLDPTNKTFSSQELNISVGTNNPYGYRLTMSSTGTSLVHTEDSNYTIPTLTSSADGYTDESFTADRWGYKQDSSAWNSYTPGVTLLESNAPVNNDNTNLSFGAKIDYNQAPGNYTLVLNFNAVAKVATNDLVITFAGEGVESVKVCKVAGDCTGDNLVGTVSNSGSSVPGLEDGSTYYLYPVFNANYEFVSWEKTSEAGTISATDILNPTFTMSDEPAAVTVAGGGSDYCSKNNIADNDCMQKMTPSSCTTTARTVYDMRDGSAYLIQKLADNKCWLLDNLRLGSADFASGVTTLDSTNTNTTNSIATSTFTGWNTTSGFINGYTVPMINTASANNTTTSYGSGSGKIGVYYNYCAATMQSYCYAAGSGTGNASEDVCPKGWRMPTDGLSGEYQALYTAYTSNATNFRNALSTPLSGDFYVSSAYEQGSVGHFWSSTYYSDKDMYRLSVASSYVSLHNFYSRDIGFSVRCVLKEPIESVTYMQDITSEMVANTAVGATATLIDKRDNQSYLVGKLADGKLWMLDNLRLGSTTAMTLTPNDTNITSDFTLPASGTECFTSPNCTGTDGETTGTGYTVPAINTDYKNTTTTGYGAGSKKIGTYYNYCAASAGTYCMASSSDGENATSDICPKGWRMPTGGPSGEYQALCDTIKGSSCGTSWADSEAVRAPLSTPLSGYFNSSGFASFQGSFGFFWSSTRYSTTGMYSLDFNSSDVYPQDFGNRYIGFSVRCILGS